MKLLQASGHVPERHTAVERSAMRNERRAERGTVTWRRVWVPGGAFAVRAPRIEDVPWDPVWDHIDTGVFPARYGLLRAFWVSQEDDRGWESLRITHLRVVACEIERKHDLDGE